MNEAYCPCCKQPMRVFVQPGMTSSMPSHVLADCWTPGCKLYAVTLGVGEHDKLTAEQIKGYAKVNKQRVNAVR